MSKLKTSLLAAAALALPLALQAPAQAQPSTTNWTGFYIGAFVGAAPFGDTPYKYDGGDDVGHKLRGGFGGGTIGYNHQLDGNIVLGLEADFAGAGIKGEDFCPSVSWRCRTKVETLGSVRARAGYALGDALIFATAGLGYGDVNVVAIDTEDNGAQYGQRKYHWGWTAGAGLEYAVVQNWSVKAEYLYYDLGSATHVNDCCDIKSQPTIHSLRLGVNYRFGAVAPAPVAAPPVVPAGKSFLVFFDWDKSTLTDRARGIIKEAAAASKATKHTVVEVNGYADTSGNPKYNMGLSMRRAQTVAAELVRNGVPKQEIAIKAFGDTVLLVPTGPGVREPQNRRVEIIIK